ncbi:hypothetical protein ACLOJK_004862, partial [Asimina triloba]
STPPPTCVARHRHALVGERAPHGMPTRERITRSVPNPPHFSKWLYYRLSIIQPSDH